MPLTEKEYIRINQALFTLAHAYESRMTREHPADKTGLTIFECAVMMVIGQTAPINSQELSRRMDVPPSTVSVYIRGLRKKGLVKSEQDQQDRRNWWLALTDQGQLVYQAIIAGTSQYTQDFFSALSDEEQRTLLDLLLKASHNLGFTWQ
ncbi:MAG: MarR family transcriptional regulator [Anaerolineales bacterium]|nr:MarR family transcriptional regulator [Anaerolineales bacterium]